jgi:hypothetical protein
MRSELVFGATTHISNRYLLTRLAARATQIPQAKYSHPGHDE